jgi:GTP cyclohydrolase I
MEKSGNKKIEEAIGIILKEILGDSLKGELLQTPLRVSQLLMELTEGYRMDPEALKRNSIFEGDYEEMVIVRDVEFYSICEHHLLPFYGKVHIAYIPDGKIIGISRIPKIVEFFSRRFQVQERLTREISDFLSDLLKPKGVAIVVEGIHLCAMMRREGRTEAKMITTKMTGVFKRDGKLMDEFLKFVGIVGESKFWEGDHKR